MDPFFGPPDSKVGESQLDTTPLRLEPWCQDPAKDPGTIELKPAPEQSNITPMISRGLEWQEGVQLAALLAAGGRLWLMTRGTEQRPQCRGTRKQHV